MSSFNSNATSNRLKAIEDISTSLDLQAFDLQHQLEKLALFLAEAWKDEHPEAQAASQADLSQCVLAVATELAIAATAVGGTIGLEILTGGGSAAACAVCNQVLRSACD